MQDLGALTKNYRPKQWKPQEMLVGIEWPSSEVSLLDLGCGTGGVRPTLEKLVPGMKYKGIDIGESPEVNSRTEVLPDILEYDGVNIPFDDGYFDVVYSQQVFEHVRHQEQLLQDIKRVLKPGGYFVGSLSGLEPYHSRSIFNVTPWGWLKVLNENGFTATTIRPGVDGLTLLNRAFTRRLGGTYEFAEVGELNAKILAMDVSDIEKNRIMLDFAGHIVFAARID